MVSTVSRSTRNRDIPFPQRQLEEPLIQSNSEIELGCRGQRHQGKRDPASCERMQRICGRKGDACQDGLGLRMLESLFSSEASWAIERGASPLPCGRHMLFERARRCYFCSKKVAPFLLLSIGPLIPLRTQQPQERSQARPKHIKIQQFQSRFFLPPRRHQRDSRSQRQLSQQSLPEEMAMRSLTCSTASLLSGRVWGRKDGRGGVTNFSGIR